MTTIHFLTLIELSDARFLYFTRRDFLGHDGQGPLDVHLVNFLSLDAHLVDFLLSQVFVSVV